ncbi:MAG: hypothetical protein N3E41_08625 [Thermofilaceae archaeon]|nr:hypothetical protein [Thermofilaceae archaeon]
MLLKLEAWTHTPEKVLSILSQLLCVLSSLYPIHDKTFNSFPVAVMRRRYVAS